MGPATGLTCPHSLVADGPLEADALLALEDALRVQLGLDRLELREAVRAPDVLLQGDALLFKTQQQSQPPIKNSTKRNLLKI